MQTPGNSQTPCRPSHPLHAIKIAPGAFEALRAGSGWRVLSSHAHACNYVDSTGRLFSLVNGRARMGPFSLEVESIPHETILGGRSNADPLILESESALVIGGRSIDLTLAARWNPRPEWRALPAIPWQGRFLSLIIATLRACAPPESLACVVAPLSVQRSTSDDPRTRLRELQLSAAAKACLRLSRTLASGDEYEVSLASGALAGLGPGLTPSGDDFLIGAMYGLWSSLPTPKAKALTEAICTSSIGRTNRVSAAWLAAAAKGQAIEAWHDLVDALRAEDEELVTRVCRQLINLGHTSGADALAGFVIVHITPIHWRSQVSQVNQSLV